MNELISQYPQIETIIDLLRYNPQQPLLFNTGLFMMLFLVFMTVYELLRNFRTAQTIFTILFSLYFYYKSSAECVVMLLGICLSDYILGRMMGFFERRWIRKIIVSLGVIIDLGLLVYFKYFSLMASAWASLQGVDFDPLQIIVPAGISFITFRSISYLVDVYRGDLQPEKSLLDYTLCLTFFAPLLAGPVVRASDLLPQIKARQSATGEMTSQGLMLIMIGLVKKVVIADYISGGFVTRIFDNPALYSGFECLMGCIGFTIQIYCDFSGYSDMAIGIALLCGYRFKDNFRAPFKSQNPAEFWHRWHISLSTWLRDYLYIPLGGSRCGKFRTYANLFTTMVIGGIWHGAGIMYIFWGIYQGLILVGHRIIKIFWKIPDSFKGSVPVRCVNVFLTFVVTLIGFTIFRCPDFETFTTICHQIAGSFHGDIALQFIGAYAAIAAAIIGGFAMHYAPTSWNNRASGLYTSMPLAIQGLVLAIVIFLIIQASSSDLVPFIYLQY